MAQKKLKCLFFEKTHTINLEKTNNQLYLHLVIYEIYIVVNRILIF